MAWIGVKEQVGEAKRQGASKFVGYGTVRMVRIELQDIQLSTRTNSSTRTGRLIPGSLELAKSAQRVDFFSRTTRLTTIDGGSAPCHLSHVSNNPMPQCLKAKNHEGFALFGHVLAC